MTVHAHRRMSGENRTDDATSDRRRTDHHSMSAALAWVRDTEVAGGTGEELAQILGADVRLEHLRYKPDYSLFARAVPAASGPPTWFALFGVDARDKVSKLRRAAKRSGLVLVDSHVPEHPDCTLLSGPIGADLRLRRRVRTVRGLVDRDGTPQGRVLSYNPWKRLVQIVESPRVGGDVIVDGRVVAKVSAAGDDEADEAVVRVLQNLRAQGVPVLEPCAVPAPGVQLFPVVPGGDLAGVLAEGGGPAPAEGGSTRADLLAETGRALAVLHAADRSGVDRAMDCKGLDGAGQTDSTGRLREVAPAARLADARDAVVALTPALVGRFDAAAALVLQSLGEIGPAAHAPDSVVLHGDFSTDQVLVGESVVLNDFDRVSAGPAGCDLGSFAAVELLSDRSGTIAPFVDAYAAAGGRPPSDIHGWTALHVLLRCVEPARNLDPDHHGKVRLRIALAGGLVRRGPGPMVAATRTTTGRTTRPQLTESVEAAGEAVAVSRAWPGAGGTQLFEGRDEAGRLRAGTLAADGAINLLPHASDDRLPGLRRGGELLVHRSGRRAVVRETAEDAPGGCVYRKHLRPKKVARVAEASETAGRLARAAGFSAPEVLTADQHSLTLSCAPGLPVADLAVREDLTAWRDVWEAWSASWPGLVRSTGGEADVHDAEQEAEVVATWSRHLSEYDPLGWCDSPAGRTMRRQYLAAADDVAFALRKRAGGLGISHRDLHDGQMLFDPATGALSLLDFDTLAYAEPELDLGNLIAHARLRQHQGLMGEQARDIALAAVDRAAEFLDADEARLEAYTRASALRLVGVYAFRPRWRAIAQSWCERLVG